MIKTQVQLPDTLYHEAKRISQQYEMSLAEVVRRGLEGIIPSYPNRSAQKEPWTLPTVSVGLVKDPFADKNWREEHAIDAVGRMK
ncbi:MAG: antitoxin [Verrucomicrobiota bacterium]